MGGFWAGCFREWRRALSWDFGTRFTDTLARRGCVWDGHAFAGSRDGATVLVSPVDRGFVVCLISPCPDAAWFARQWRVILSGLLPRADLAAGVKAIGQAWAAFQAAGAPDSNLMIWHSELVTGRLLLFRATCGSGGYLCTVECNWRDAGCKEADSLQRAVLTFKTPSQAPSGVSQNP